MENKNFKTPKKQGTLHKLGDKVEKLGEKITRAGAPKVGRAVYKAGNKLEHLKDEEE